jgi:co-chaperonin GroES (HSP10)
MDENVSTRMLLTELSQEEKNARGEEVGNVIAEIESLQDQLKAASGGIKAKINDAKKKERRLGHILATGKEEREVQVRTDKDWEHKEVILIRLDTNEVVERRTMTASEAQADLLDRGAEPGKLLAMDGGKAEGGGDAQQPELSDDEKVWADAIDGTGKHFDDDEEEESPVAETDGTEESGEGEDAPAPEPAQEPKRSPRRRKESA